VVRNTLILIYDMTMKDINLSTIYNIELNEIYALSQAWNIYGLDYCKINFPYDLEHS